MDWNEEHSGVTFSDIEIGDYFIDDYGVFCVKTSENTAKDKFCATNFDVAIPGNTKVFRIKKGIE